MQFTRELLEIQGKALLSIWNVLTGVNKSELQSKLSSQLFPQLLLLGYYNFIPMMSLTLQLLTLGDGRLERGVLVLVMHYPQKRDLEGPQS